MLLPKLTMAHLFPGFSGTVCVVAIGAVVWTQRRRSKAFPAYNLGPGGNPKEYEPILARYIRFAEFMIGLATGSIVLIVGSSTLHSQGGHLPWFYASPLLLLGGSVLYGLLFMAAQLVTMEEVLHGNPHTAFNYALNETLGYSSLICFLMGYIWLVYAVTNFA
jgi:hypothetical protein